MKFLFIFFLPIFCFSQQQFDVEVKYKLTFISDSTDTQNVKSDIFSLLINKNKSFFASDTYIKKDSIANEIAKTFNFSNAPKLKFRYIVAKQNNETYFYDEVLKNKLYYKEKINFDWQIVPDEKTTIGKFVCFKAITHYGGRDWIAWFTNEIPIHDGPYKFSNLPGLILKITDSKGEYSFEMVSIKQNIITESPVFLTENLRKYRKLDKATFLQTEKRLNENIVNEFSNRGIIFKGQDAKQVKDNLRKKNNPIELTW